MTLSDLELLRNYVRAPRQLGQEAFTTLVHRHLNLVHSAALRQVRSPQLAEDVAQSVFADLAQNAAQLVANKLQPSGLLTPWLYSVTRRTAIDLIRKESRRQLREQVATEMNAMNATTSDWMQIEPLLDDAMSALDETDRAAVLLRYFENKSLREVGATLGTSDDAAQKRVSRAVERLREFFANRGVTVGVSGLVVVVSANAVQAAPVGLAVTISAAAATLAGTTIATTATKTKALAMTTLQKLLIVTTILVGLLALQYNEELARMAEELSEWRPHAHSSAAETEHSGQANSLPSNEDACRKNLIRIDIAVAQYALENRQPNGAQVSSEQILPYIGSNALPSCPSGGTYTLGPVGGHPSCSVTGHFLP